MPWIIGEIRKGIERLGREIESRRILCLELYEKFYLNKSVIALKRLDLVTKVCFKAAVSDYLMWV